MHSQHDLQQFPSCGLISLEDGADDSIQVQLQCENDEETWRETPEICVKETYTRDEIKRRYHEKLNGGGGKKDEIELQKSDKTSGIENTSLFS